MSTSETVAKRLCVLLVEDNPGDVDLIQARAEEDELRPLNIQVCPTLALAIDAVREGHPDLVLLDLGLPDSTGIRTFEQMHAAAGDTPIIVLTGHDDATVAEKCIALGAHDYLLKGKVEQFINWAAYNTVARAAASRALRESHENMKRMVADNQDPMLVLDAKGFVKFSNEAAVALFGDGVAEGQAFTIPASKRDAQEINVPGTNGDEVTVEMRKGASNWYGEEVQVLSFRDVTERKRAEQEREEMRAQLIHAQKLESLGTLAGGVAHEINNPINAIMNYAQLIIDLSSHDKRGTDFGKEIINESERVAAIVKNLLSFARMEKDTTFRTASLEDIINATLGLVRTIIRHDLISLEIDVPKDLPRIRCRGQELQQVLLNLITNARDAVNQKFSDQHPDKKIRIVAGPQPFNGSTGIRLTVEDHGAGIPEGVRDRVFDPFFTTKPSDQGTGLGLSISHGIIKEHKGTMSVESIEGEWTRIHVDLPVAKASDSAYLTTTPSGDKG